MASEMSGAYDLVPELALWNNGAGIALDDWIRIVGRADHALGFGALFWPKVVKFEDYHLREPFDESHLRGWEKSGATRAQIEVAVNVLLFDHIFPQDEAATALKERQTEAMANMMRDMLKAKLQVDFPDQVFNVLVLEDDDFGLSFHRA